MVTWQIINVLSPLSQSLWTPRLAGLWLRKREPHPQSHVIHQPPGHVTPRSRSHLVTIQYVVFICSTSSWRCFKKAGRFQIILTPLKMCSSHKKIFMVTCYFLAGCLYGGSVDAIMCFWVYIKVCSISPD